MLIPAATTLDHLVRLTAPGAPVTPVIRALDEVQAGAAAARPALVQAKASVWMLGEVDRIRGAAQTLRDSLAELQERDGMTSFDPAFAADDAAWDAWFTESAGILRIAAGIANEV
ncbi:MAG: hypothetical protein ABI200_08155 [Gaiellales bacterium]